MRAELNKPVTLIKGLLILLVLQMVVSLVFYLKGLTSIPEGPILRMAEASRSVWSEYSLSSPRYLELHNFLMQKSRSDCQRYWQDVYSLAVSGQFYSMHCPLLSILAAPFYGLFGDFGFWLFAQIMTALIVISLLRLARRFSGKLLLAHVLLIGVGTPILLYAPYFSHDLFGTMLIICGVDLLTVWPIWGALCLGTAVFVRPSHIMFLPLLAFAYSGEKRSRVSQDIFLGAFLPVAIFFYFNHAFWGSVLTTTYARMPNYHCGEIGYYQAIMRLDIFLSDWWAKLFGSPYGFLTFSPGLFLVPWAFIKSWSTREFWYWIVLLATCLAQIVLTFSFDGWAVSDAGSRYLLPVSCLLLMPVFQAIRAKDT